MLTHEGSHLIPLKQLKVDKGCQLSEPLLHTIFILYLIFRVLETSLS